MEKYVAFLDILGFKSRMKKMTQSEAEAFIQSFSQLLYDEWASENLNSANLIKGFIVSDSIVIHTESDSPEALNALLTFIISVCRKCFSERQILLRCAIAKGNYSHLAAVGFDNLQKGLIVGDAYIEAYTLEDSSKTSAIIVTEKVYNDINEFFPDKYTFEKGSDIPPTHLIKWLDMDYLLDGKNLRRFCELANDSDWLPVYYNTLYLCFSCENSTKKRDQVFLNIASLLRRQEGASYIQFDKFISNAFGKDVNLKFQKMFSRFLRTQIKDENLE